MPNTPPDVAEDTQTPGALAKTWRELWPYVVIVVLTAFTYRTSTSFALIGDAEFLIEHNQQTHELGSWWTVLSSDYFDAMAARSCLPQVRRLYAMGRCGED
jgi:hypothetical protein